MIANINGEPRPPLRMIEPSGAPIRNKTRHAADNAILRCHSIRCKRRSFFLLSYSATTTSFTDFAEKAWLYDFSFIQLLTESGSNESKVLEDVNFSVSGFFQVLSKYLLNEKKASTSFFILTFILTRSFFNESMA